MRHGSDFSVHDSQGSASSLYFGFALPLQLFPPAHQRGVRVPPAAALSPRHVRLPHRPHLHQVGQVLSRRLVLLPKSPHRSVLVCRLQFDVSVVVCNASSWWFFFINSEQLTCVRSRRANRANHKVFAFAGLINMFLFKYTKDPCSSANWYSGQASKPFLPDCNFRTRQATKFHESN